MTSPATALDQRRAAGATITREALLAGLAVLTVHALTRIWVAPGAYHDDAVYLALGKSLVEGSGWHSIYAVGAPVHLKYPPAVPAIYAVLWWVGGSIGPTLGLVHAFHLLVSGVSGAMAWAIVRARFGSSRLAAACALTPFAMVSLVDHWQLSIAEGPFVAAWLAALLVALAPPTHRRALALGAWLAFATLLRTQGWALIGGMLLALVFMPDRRRYAATVAATAVVPVLAWAAYVADLASHGPVSTQPNESGYLAPLTQMPFASIVRAVATTVSINVVEYARMLGRETGPGALGFVLAAACGVLAVAGALRDRWRVAPVSFTLACSMALLLVLPYNQERYLIAVLPVAALLTVHGWPAVGRHIPRSAARTLAALAAVVMLFHQRAIRLAATSEGAQIDVGFEPVGLVLTRNTKWLEAVVPWVASHTPTDAKIFTEGATGVWLATGRVGVAALWPAPIFMPVAESDPAAVAARLVSDSITVVIASSPSIGASVTALDQRCPGTFRRMDNIAGLATALSVNLATRECLRAVAGVALAP